MKGGKFGSQFDACFMIFLVLHCKIIFLTFFAPTLTIPHLHHLLVKKVMLAPCYNEIQVALILKIPVCTFQMSLDL